VIRDKFLSRSQWEKKLRDIGAEPLAGKGPLNTAEWWRVPDKTPFTVPIEDDGRCDFWAIHRICKEQGGPWQGQ
jgi:hypothetical protein